MFEGLTERLQGIFKRLRGHGVLSEKNISEAMREVRMALLEADVHFRVVKQFIQAVQVKAVGQEVLRSVNPGQQVVKIVHDEMVKVLGSEAVPLQLNDRGPTRIMVTGLHGSGKTTFCGKLGRRLLSEGRHPLLVACDVNRPAAIKQLQVVGESADLPVFAIEGQKRVGKIARKALDVAKKQERDIIIYDTAGRLHVDKELMRELVELREMLDPDEVLLVADAMTGQDAVRMAQQFHEHVGVTGVVLSKLDGDARGGAAISVRAVTDAPIKFVGVGEKLADLEVFHPDRMASRILGMGDVVSLVERAQEAIDEEQAAELERKLRHAEINLEDFRQQLQQVKKMGSMDEVLNMLPGMSAQMQGMKFDESQFVRFEAIINSMTMVERLKPNIINGSRRRRIARGSGTRVQDVNRLLKEFGAMKKLFKRMGKTRDGGRGLLRNLLPF